MKNKATSILYFFSAVLSIISAILNFLIYRGGLRATHLYLGICFICLSITFFSLGLLYHKKQK